MGYSAIDFAVERGVARITLNRPDDANALDATLARDLFDVAIACDADPEVRAVLITGAGAMFCGGGDLRAFRAQGENLRAHLLGVTAHLHGAISRLVRGDAPLVAAVNGAAAGAGLSLACACDLVVAAESARFRLAYTRVGLTPDGSATYFLARRIGLGRASDLALTNRVLSAGEAESWGLVNRVVPDAELPAAAGDLARELAAGPTGAFAAARRLLREGLTETLETQMEAEARAIAAAAMGEDAREGMSAFLDKRPPSFGGRRTGAGAGGEPAP